METEIKKGEFRKRKIVRVKTMPKNPSRSRLTQSFVQGVIADNVGEDTLPVVAFLKDKKDISEFQIAEKVKLEVNTIRNILYRLHNQDLVSYIRKKDRIKGWYISYWTLNLMATKHILKKQQLEQLENLKERLLKEERNLNTFFMCKSFCARVDFGTASDLFFKCPECGQLLEMQNNTKTIANIKQKIHRLEVAM